MRTLVTFCLLLFFSLTAHAQIFWTENFESGSSMEVTTYSGTNGAWTLSTGTEGADPNMWYVSCEEAGHVAGDCGSACTASPGTGASLHISPNIGTYGDLRATYDGGPAPFDVLTDRRAESPTINCAGRYNISVKFNYIENGDGANDDGLVWYYDGSAWTMLANPPKTTNCISGQGQWATYSVSLPASANNNPNVKIGFQWVNNNDGIESDPSFAVDSLSLLTTPAPTPTFTLTPNLVCQDSCITFTNTTVGAVDSIRWMIVGAPYTSTVAPAYQLCIPGIVPAGPHTMRLYVFKGGAVDSVDHTFTVNPAPHPVIIRTLNTFSVTGAYTGYQWYNGTTRITGATNSGYTTTVEGSYSVVVDSGGCKGTATYSTLLVGDVSNGTQAFWVDQNSGNTISLFSAEPLDEQLTVSVFDATGRNLHSEVWSKGATNKQIDAGFYSPGLYYIRITGQGSVSTLRWLKK